MRPSGTLTTEQETFRAQMAAQLPEDFFGWFLTPEEALCSFLNATNFNLSPTDVMEPYACLPSELIWHCAFVLQNPSFALLELEYPDLREIVGRYYLRSWHEVLSDAHDGTQEDRHFWYLLDIVQFFGAVLLWGNLSLAHQDLCREAISWIVDLEDAGIVTLDQLREQLSQVLTADASVIDRLCMAYQYPNLLPLLEQTE